MGHVRKVPNKRQAVVDDDTKLNLLLALEENPITPARQLARDSNLNHKTVEGGDVLLLATSVSDGLKCFQYDGWHFVESKIQFGNEVTSRGIAAMHSYKFQDKTIVEEKLLKQLHPIGKL
ncbi:hypothetical protein NQ318_020502 [Aromia moschata]|uniref:Uncharacterized protein n=1 Tax=Aromia moschata TaxID=1265417 RepID=A0AAV8YES4_9CUCU|nr:hypothetical protein NQ318_020502 [Aromia moschata]